MRPKSHRTETRFRGSHTTALAYTLRAGLIPSRASTPLSECHRYATTVVRSLERFCSPAVLLLSDRWLPTVPSEVLSPTAFSQPHGATDPQRVPNTLVPLRPQGFAPSRRFAPRAISRAYFIPIPILGFTLRGFDPRAVPYALSGAESLRILETTPLLSCSPSVQGSCTPPGAQTAGPGV